MIILGADLHIHPHQSFDTFTPESDRLKDGLRSLQWMGRVADEVGASDLIIAGDLFHRRHNLSVKVIDAVVDVLGQFRESAFHTHLLAGNHDQSTYHDTSLRPLAQRHISVHESPTRIRRGRWAMDFVPYREDPDDFMADLESLGLCPGVLHHYLICHQSVAGARRGAFEYCPPHSIQTGDVPIYYTHVFSGHYHEQQMLGDRWCYIGSAIQLDRSDRGQDKGCVVLDETKGVWVRNKYTGAPRFLESVYNGQTLNEPRDQFKGMFVDVYYPYGTRREDVGGEMRACGARSIQYHVDPSTVPEDVAPPSLPRVLPHDRVEDHIKETKGKSRRWAGWGRKLLGDKA